LIGNPPYEELSEDERGKEIPEIEYFRALDKYDRACSYRLNLYRFFIAQALTLLKTGGRHSFIVPISILGDRFTYPLREQILEETNLDRIERFPQKDDPTDRVFPDAKLSTCIYVLSATEPENNSVFVRSHPGRDILEESPSYQTRQGSFLDFDEANLTIPGLDQEAWDTVLSWPKDPHFVRIGDIAETWRGEIMVNRSVEPYRTSKEDGEEVIRGAHIGPYSLIEPKQGEALYLDREKYLKDHQDSEAAHHHEEERIVYQRYAAIDNYRRLIATLLPEGLFCSHTVGYFKFDSPYDPGYLLSHLNSELLDWRFNLASTNNNINGYELEVLPIREVKFTKPVDERENSVSTLIDQYETARAEDNSPDDNPVLDAVVDHLDADPERSGIVHDLLAHLAREMTDLKSERATYNLDITEYVPEPSTEDGVAITEIGRYEPASGVTDSILAETEETREKLHIGSLYAEVEENCVTVQATARYKPDESDEYTETNPIDFCRLKNCTDEEIQLLEHWLNVLSERTMSDSTFAGYRANATTNISLRDRLFDARFPDLDQRSTELAPFFRDAKEAAELDRQIEFTDSLIDQIVYRLYGLSDEEIAVVENTR
jgi:hypothetical protein